MEESLPITTDGAKTDHANSKVKRAAVVKPVVSAYNDYRQFLKDFYRFKRQEYQGIRPYNYAVFAAAADFRSPNYLRMVIEGERNLSEESIKKFARGLQFNRDEEREFCLLVKYNQTTEPIEKNNYLQQLTSLRGKKQIQRGEVSVELWDKVTSWVAWVIFAMVDQENVDFSVDGLHRLIRSRVSKDAIKTAMQQLINEKDLIEDPLTGRVLRSREVIGSIQHIPSEVIRKVQAEFIYLAVESLYKDEAQEREISGLTVALTKEEFQEVKFYLRKMRKDFQTKFAAQRSVQKAERVYQLNIQLFPVTDKKNS